MDVPAEPTEAMNVVLFANELKGGLCGKDRRGRRDSHASAADRDAFGDATLESATDASSTLPTFL